MDNVSKKERSRIMSLIKSQDSGIEKAVRKLAWGAGLRYRKNAKSFYGKPDLVLQKRKVVIFVDSCFWHGCKKHCRMPKTNKAYWGSKIAGNKARDKKVNQHYKKLGWRIIRIWEHNLHSP